MALPVSMGAVVSAATIAVSTMDVSAAVATSVDVSMATSAGDASLRAFVDDAEHAKMSADARRVYRSMAGGR